MSGPSIRVGRKSEKGRLTHTRTLGASSDDERPRLLNPVLRLLFVGLRDPNSSLFLLRGHDHVVRITWGILIKQYAAEGALRLLPRAKKVPMDVWGEKVELRGEEQPPFAFAALGRVPFPPFRGGLNVNMLPINLRNLAETLPAELQQYEALIERCPYNLALELAGKGSVDHDVDPRADYAPPPDGRGPRAHTIAYLTVTESMVRPGETQRRGGLHTEQPGLLRGGGGSFAPGQYHAWGSGSVRENLRMMMQGPVYVGGIYMASSLDNSCEVRSDRLILIDWV